MKMSRFSSNISSMVKYYSTNVKHAPILNPTMPNLKMFINNEWVDSAKPDNYYTPINPVTESVITKVQSGCKEDLDRAVEAARNAFHPDAPWRKMDASNRGKIMTRLADLMDRDAAYLASLETLEIGKVYGLALTSDIFFSAQQIRHSATWSDKINGQVIATDGDCSCYTKYEPVGVCAGISSWNFPTLMNCVKLSIGLIGGNTIILKPSQHGSLTTLHIAQLAKEAGFPPGVLNVVPGTGELGNMMCSHPDIELVSFTGSTEVGQKVYTMCSGNIKRMILELGGKSPLIVCEDADLDNAVQAAHTAIFHNAGQCCCAASRTYVQESIFEEFVNRSVEVTKKRTIGNPFDPKTHQGPQATKSQLQKILEMVEIGKNEGGTVMHGGTRLGKQGYFMSPTIFTDVNEDMTIVKDEIFGPVQTIMPYKTLDEAIDKANNTQYGLAASIFTKDINNISLFSDRIRAGSIWVNCYFNITMQAPFGGYKMSGIGREGGIGGIRAFLEEKSVHIKNPLKL